MNRAIVLGAGSWGTALSSILAEKIPHVHLLGRDAALMGNIQKQRVNTRYLPHKRLPDNLITTTDLNQALQADLILFVVPSQATTSLAGELSAKGLSPNTVLLSCAKGITPHGETMSQLLASFFPHNPLAVLSGPNHAEEIAQSLTSCSVIGSYSLPLATQLQSLLTTSFLRCYTSEDVLGIEWGGALKNVFALAAGMAVGIGLGDNALSALVTRALAEMTRMGTQLGGKPETFVGLSGLGDLTATCYSTHSRNHRVGKALAQGKKLPDILKELGMVAEGIVNTEILYKKSYAIGTRTPLLDAVYAVVYQGRSPHKALKDLLSNDLRSEVD